jgi:tetratricopeptide (TPR) repeat protein
MRKLSVICYRLLVLLGIILLNFSSEKCLANEPASAYQKANNLYQKNSFDSAAKIYEKIISDEYFSTEVYFNLANCYYKTNKTAKAILNYERALKLKPNDEDILFNIKVAQLKMVDKIETVPEIFYVRWTKNFAAIFSVDGWGKAITICVWLMFLFASVYAVSQNPTLKKASLLFTFIFLLFTSFAWFLAKQNFESTKINKSAIIMSESVYVKSSPGENNTDLFLLHEGTKASILDEFENWQKIKISNGSVGWVKKNDLEVI